MSARKANHILPSKPDLQIQRAIAAARAEGLTEYKVGKRGKEVYVLVGSLDSGADDIQAKIESMVDDGQA
ncbi:hypothetical protein [Parvularcula sp. IMCC14364]|uniref:hypothetical protein n=1 Tax=Parvularcula sp. IMCC14364 TaxID=3067902 RepID=UPI002740A3C5|nr:hypothetical protein [Parvularcula sp. IMCC14364]